MGSLIPFSTPTPMPLAGAIAVPPKNTNTKTVPKVRIDDPPVMREMKGEVYAPPPQSEKDSFEVGKIRVLSAERKIS